MPRIRTLFLLLTLIGPLHMVEQLLTDIEEFHMIRRQLSGYYAWFDPAAADSATVILITIVWTVTSFLFYSLLFDNRVRLIVPGVLGLFGVTEIHHVIESMQKAGYDPGVVTCIPYAVVGAMLVATVWRELKQGQRSTGDAVALATSQAG